MSGVRILRRFIALIVVSLLASCIHLEVLQVRFKAEELYKEGRTNEIIPMVESTLAKVEKELGPDHYYVGEAYNGLGILYAYTINDFEKSEEFFKRALAIRTKSRGPEHPDTIETMNLMGFLYQVTGKLDLAESYIKKAYELRKKVLGPDHPDTADSEIYLAGLYMRLGRYAEAEKLALHASEREQVKVTVRHPTPGEGYALLGSIYSMMGDTTRSIKAYTKSAELQLKELGPEHSEVSHNLQALGNTYIQLGDMDNAIKYLDRALAIKEKTFGHVHGFTGDTLTSLGSAYLLKGDQEQADRYLNDGLEVYKKSMGADNYRVLYAQQRIAFLYLAQNDFEKTRALCEEILASPYTQTLKSLSWSTQTLYSLVQYRLGNVNAAILFGKNAVNELQSMRTELSTLEAGLQKGFVQERATSYRNLAAILIESGRLMEAQQVLTMLKEDEHFSYVRRSSQFHDIRKTRVDYNAVENQWQQRYEEVNARLAATGKKFQVLRSKKKSGLTPDEQAELEQARNELKIAQNAFKAFLEELASKIQQVDQTRAAEIGEKNLSSLKAMQGTLRELGQGVALLHYLITDDTLYAILTTPNVQIVRRSAIKSGKLNQQINKMRTVLQNSASDPRPIAQETYDTLFAPIAEDLNQAGTNIIMVSLDGALRYLPLAALYDGNQFLAEKYAFVVFTAAAQTKLISSPKGEWSIAGMGIVKETEGFSSLPSVKAELDRVIRTGPDDNEGILPGEIYLDESFTRNSLVNALDTGYPVLHIASHFVFRPGSENNSFLLLGDGQQLSLAEISDENYDFNGVDMLTLSACETAVGSPGANGKEIEGFGWLAQRQGAKSVLATLWPVADISTGLFMQKMYALKQNDKLTKASAIQQTQQAFLHSKQFSHPFFWAPFILMGNWL